MIKGWWKDTGTPEEFLICNMLALEKVTIDSGSAMNHNQYWRANIESNVSIDKDSKIIGPCFIGSGTKIINSYIGPYTSIGKNCKIKDTHIENSVVMDNVSLNLNLSATIRESLIGPSTVVLSSNPNQKSFKFTVGRDSGIEV